ncbi:hypothetical protein HD554DRAFT_2042812 [Boletus coccyginus]|nr:hypothetical protein HD554DRAFT_2042812 [Boletus coccyginus]
MLSASRVSIRLFNCEPIIVRKATMTSFIKTSILDGSPCPILDPFLSVQIKCSCVALNYEIPPGYMASLAAPIKRTAVEKQVNVHIIFLFGFLLALSVRSTIGASVNTWYFFQSNAFSDRALINLDLDLYYGTSSLVEELGQIEFIFSDKTGTLSRNEVEFSVSIGGVVYAEEVDKSRKADTERDEEGVKESWRMFDDRRRVLDGTSTSGKAPKNPFSAEAMAMSDGVLRERVMALLAACHTVIPEIRKSKSVFVYIQGQTVEYETLNVWEFNSTRKRMSTVVRALDDSPVHRHRVCPMGIHLHQSRNKALDQAAELIEKGIFLLGATVTEDKQEGVPDTIHTLQEAGIKIWVLTGDRQETAINIGENCRLAGERMNLMVANEETARETAEFIGQRQRLGAIGNQGISGDSVLVIGRVSPLQKALVVKLVKKNQNSIWLVIGYGANDTRMIQAAHVGVGISGVEFRYLKKLLMHGAWSYQLILRQIAYESWTISFYNVIFTVLPPLVMGIFDQFVSAHVLNRYPQLYASGKQECVFTKTAFWLWIGNALYHSLFVDQVQCGGHPRLVRVHDGLSPALRPRRPRLRFLDRVRRPLWTNAVFYLALLLVPVICLTQDLAWKYYKRTYDPRSYHVAQEVQKYNVLDYRPRQAQFQKAIKKVRAVQRTKRNAGFAFSQTERGAGEMPVGWGGWIRRG